MYYIRLSLWAAETGELDVELTSPDGIGVTRSKLRKCAKSERDCNYGYNHQQRNCAQEKNRKAAIGTTF